MRAIKKIISSLFALFGYRITKITRGSILVNEVIATEKTEEPEPKTAQDIEFEFISLLPGFLDRDAYELFCKLGQIFQKKTPEILEVGIFCGKSFLALGLAFKSPSRLVGVDPFYEDFKDSPALEDEGEYLEQASEYLTGKQRLALLEKTLANSKNFRADLPAKFTILEMTQDDFFKTKKVSEKFDVVHIDGEHTFQAVYDFFDQVDTTLNTSSIVIVDDFLNPGFPEISEAVHIHPTYKKEVFPVFYGFNKAVFLYKPVTAQVKKFSSQLSKAYRSEGRAVRPLVDGSVTVQ
ncbi:MAG: class I SAM-dependent methyltransferase [Candidatus Saccharimonadales bacterium]